MSVILQPGDQIYLNFGAMDMGQAQRDYDRMAAGFKDMGIHIIGWSWSSMATGVSIGYVFRRPPLAGPLNGVEVRPVPAKDWVEVSRG